MHVQVEAVAGSRAVTYPRLCKELINIKVRFIPDNVDVMSNWYISNRRCVSILDEIHVKGVLQS